MRRNLLYIFTLIGSVLFTSCEMEEKIGSGTDKDGLIEFVFKPTTYGNMKVSTKVTTDQISALENNINTAFFLLFDNDGNRVIFADLTSADKTYAIKPDVGLSNGTACFLANVSTSYAKSLKTMADLKGGKPIEINYATVATECIGIPLLTDSDKSLENVYSIPMAGILEDDFSKTDGTTVTKQIDVERLFAKIFVKIGVGISNEKSQFTLKNFVVNNIPEKVAVMRDSDSTYWAASTNIGDYLQTDNVWSSFNYDDGEDDSNVVKTGWSSADGLDTRTPGEYKSLFFYVPEHCVPKDNDNDYGSDVREQHKSRCIKEGSDKKPIYISILGDLIDGSGNSLFATYNIYLGENNYDDFSLKRNRQYTNTVTINGTEAENRVNLDYGFIDVSFKRATYLDSHFEVRPLRVKWNDDETPASGTVKIEILDAYDDAAEAPDWVRLERPSETDRSTDTYCGTIGKRKYFTTDLVTETLASSGTSIEYSIANDSDGDYPTWVYVDEFVKTESDVFQDAVRQAKVRITYTAVGGTEPENTLNFVITQRSVYPVTATNQDVTNALGVSTGKYVYGIEYFEEYLYNYDALDITESDGDGYVYDSTQDGMEWGLDGVQLSHLYNAIVMPTVSSKSTNTLAQVAVNLLGDVIASLITNQIQEQEDIAKYQYDFYLTKDNIGSEYDVTYRDYSGMDFNKEILNYITENNAADLKTTSLGDVPKSAIEYCYNKNKRNSSGQVETIHWYLPAIDEIEDITKSAYESFDVFQNRFYWSCQPSYHINEITVPRYTLNVYNTEVKSTTTQNKIADATFTGEGEYYIDNTSRARATKIDDEGANVDSGVSGSNVYENQMQITGAYYYNSTQKYTKLWSYWIPSGSPTITSGEEALDPIVVAIKKNEAKDYKYDAGNLPRTGRKNRVRCVYSKEGFSLN